MLIKTHHYNYSIEGMRNKINTTLEEYYRIKVDIKCVFLFFLILKQNTHPKHPQSTISFTKSTNPQCPILT